MLRVMTIWILALLLLAGTALVGFYQGAIRVGISLIGIIVAALLAGPLARFLYPIFPPLGVANPVLIWLIAPLVIFCLVLSAFKGLGYFVHRKVDVHYKYKAGDLQMSLWNRLNQRLGACLGLANGVAYLVLICAVFYPLAYLTAQASAGEQDPGTLRFFNKVGRDLDNTGMSRVAGAVNVMPPTYYETTDIIGLIYHNPLLQSRLGRYPAFLALTERPEFVNLTADQQLTEMTLRQTSVAEVLANAQVKAIVNNPQLQREIWDLLVPDITDLKAYLETGRSEKYDPERILGRWNFDTGASVMALKRLRPNVTAGYLRQLRAFFYPRLAGAVLKASPDKQVFLKEVARMKPGTPQPGARPGTPVPPVIEMVSFKGTWEKSGDKYDLSMDEGGQPLPLEASFEGDRLLVTGEAVPLVFIREE